MDNAEKIKEQIRKRTDIRIIFKNAGIIFLLHKFLL